MSEPQRGRSRANRAVHPAKSRAAPSAMAPAAPPDDLAGHLTADQVTEEKLSYVWEPYLPFGTYCLIEGDEGVGKSLWAAKLIADLTGGPRIDGGRRRRPGRRVLYLPAEEPLSTIVVPRLRAAGSDLSLVSFGPRAASSSRVWIPAFPNDLGRLEEELVRLRPAAVIFEPLVSFFAGDCDWRRDQDCKKVLDPLGALAERFRCLMLGARHWLKGGKGQGTSRGMGGRCVSGNARAVLQLGKDSGADGGFALCAIKFASSGPPPVRAYRIVPGNGWDVIDLGKAIDLRADELSRETSLSDAQKMLAARLLLRNRIGDAWVPSADLVRAATAEGISASILYEAKGQDEVPHKWDTSTTPKRSLWGPPKGGWPKIDAKR